MKKTTQAIAFIMIGILSACDEATEISHVDRLPNMVLDELWKIQDPRGIPVEIHGSPFRRITDADLTALLKVPANAPQDISFYPIPAGSSEAGYPWRLILHFNGQGPPNAVRDCAMTAEARTNALPEKGFSMNLVFCKDKLWQAHGFMQVHKIEDDDREAFTTHFQSLLSAIFQKETNR